MALFTCCVNGSLPCFRVRACTFHACMIAGLPEAPSCGTIAKPASPAPRMFPRSSLRLCVSAVKIPLPYFSSTLNSVLRFRWCSSSLHLVQSHFTLGRDSP